MNPERWAQIESLYHAALERAPEARAAFLNEACAGDETLRRQVAALLVQEEAAADFIAVPALEVAARVWAADLNEPTSLQPESCTVTDTARPQSAEVNGNAQQSQIETKQIENLSCSHKNLRLLFGS